MAYNAENDLRKELGLFGKNNRGDKIAVTKITNTKSGDVSYDIRNMYTTEDGEVRPTAKGVRIREELMDKIINVLLKENGCGLEQDLDLDDETE